MEGYEKYASRIQELLFDGMDVHEVWVYMKVMFQIEKNEICFRAYLERSGLIWFAEAGSRRQVQVPDLEDGMVVEQRDGNMYLVLAGKAVRKGRCNHIDGYTDDLKWEGYTGGDIVKVYRITPESLGCIEDVFIKSNLELIWERTETKKMTIEEMRQKLEELTGEEIEVTA